MTPDPLVVLSLVVLPFAGAAAVPLVFRVLGERTAYFAAGVAAVCFALVATLAAGEGGTAAFQWIPSIGVSLRFYVDGLSLLIGFLASGIGVLILTYSGGYMHGEPSQPKYYASLLAFMGSMLGVAFAADLIALFVFWELTSLSSFLLIGHYQKEAASQYAARKSMLITVAGGLFMLVAFVFLYVASGDVAALDGATWAFAGENSMLAHPEAMREALVERDALVPVLALLAIGAGAKSAQVPLHIWLPNAMEAPTPVSAFLHSATMVKAGVYLIGRMRPLLATEQWGMLFVAVGLTTMTVAAVLAVSATDIKELLAYSTASHLGLIVAGFAIVEAGFGAKAGVIGGETGAFHILNHALFKATLFLVAGIVAHEAGTRMIDDLGGLRDDLPYTTVMATLASLSMAGVPIFNGFYSKELLFEATWYAAVNEGGVVWLLPVVAVLGSVFTFLYSIRFLMLFWGDRPDGLGEVHSPPLAMLVPPAILTVGVVIVSLVPNLAVDVLIQRVVDSTAVAHGEGGHTFTVKYPTSPSPYLGMSVLTLVLGAGTYPFYDRLHDGINRLLTVDPLRANWYYDGLTEGLNPTSTGVRDGVETGHLRTYAWWIVGTFCALTLGGYLATGVTFIEPDAALSLTLGPIILVLALAAVAAVAVARAPSHIAGVLTLSIVGFMVAIFYILASAPDLALTQLVVETLVLIIFLLVLDKLPAFYGEVRRSVLARDTLLSAVVGLTVFATVVVATSADDPGEVPNPITGYFVNEAFPQGGGHNIVNIILVDFRAFDTLGEIAVVAMAALSVMTLVAMREGGETS